MSDERAIKFQHHRRSIVRSTHALYPSLDDDTIDMIYVDCWPEIAALPVIKHFTGLMRVVLVRRVKNHLRDSTRSEDIFMRWHRLTDDDANMRYDEKGMLNKGTETWVLANRTDEHTKEAYLNELLHKRVEATMASMPRTIERVGWWSFVDGETLKTISERLGLQITQVWRLQQRFIALFKEKYIYLTKLDRGFM